MKILVCDSGPIIHLFEIKNLQLLFNMGEVFIPSTVKMEIEKYLDSIPLAFGKYFSESFILIGITDILFSSKSGIFVFAGMT